jgi:hypothetical protein
MRRAARVDNNQADIVEALRRIGVSVEIISKPLDLLICHRGETSLMECKCPNPDGGDHGYTKDQVEFIARWPGKIHVAHSAEEAVRLVLGAEAMA